MIIQLLDGTQYDIDDYGLKRLFHRIPSLEVVHNSVSVDGRSNLITDTQFNNRVISVEMLYQVYDIHDFYLLRDELNALFVKNEAFFIIFKREPYKRWKVRLSSQFTLDPNPAMQSFTVDFITENPYAESVATTGDLKQWDIDKFGWNNMIDWDEDWQYSFSSNNCNVQNLGNVVIDPRESELEIILKGTFANNVKITNRTTGEIYQYNRSLNTSDTLVITGVRTFKNGVSDFRNTNKKLLSLAVGDNNIVIEGGTVNSVVFNYRFLYK